MVLQRTLKGCDDVIRVRLGLLDQATVLLQALDPAGNIGKLRTGGVASEIDIASTSHWGTSPSAGRGPQEGRQLLTEPSQG